MLGRVGVRAWRHHVLRSGLVPLRAQSPPPLFQAGTVFPVRNFFFGSDGRDDRSDEKDAPANAEGNATDGLDGSGGSEGSEPFVIRSDDGSGEDSDAMVARVGTGDDAPKPSPLLSIPLSRRPLFPGMVQGLLLSNKNYVNAMTDLQGKYVGLFLRKEQPLNDTDDPELISSVDEIYRTGTLAQIHNVAPAGADSAIQVFFTIHRRIDWTNVVDMGPPLNLDVLHWDPPALPPDSDADMIQAYSNEIVAVIRDLVKINPLFREHAQYFTTRIDISNPFKLADFVASLTTAEGAELQAVLEERSAKERLSKALLLISKEREMSRLQQEIQQRVEEKISKQQREYFLNEQLKSIKKELGVEKDDKDALVQKFRDRVDNATGMSAEAKATIEDELLKLKSIEKNSPEFNMTRNYLDWLTNMPWGITKEETFDLTLAKSVLDDDHYGLDEVKDRILEFIAVGKLKGSVQGKIMCLVGPPGVGKTSIGKSIARALNRDFYRFSVGGLTDVAEVKGHRRTYVGAMPGKPIQCLKATGSSNPLILIDEVDKLGVGYKGDPASALLELLDPSQNTTFTDHYLDLPVDMSKALFLCTANLTDTIPGPLLDRMEVVRLSGYDLPEKVKIAEQYLIPKAMVDTGLSVQDEPEQATEEAPIEVEAESGAVEKGTSGWMEMGNRLTGWGESSTGSSTSTSTTDDSIPTSTSASTSSLLQEGSSTTDSNPLVLNVPEGLKIDGSAIYALVRWYCREAGVRSLQQKIEQICRKLALKVVRFNEATVEPSPDSRTFGKGATHDDDWSSWEVTEANLADYVGKPVFTKDRLYEGQPPAGVVMGLAWTAMGGSSLYIEATAIVKGGSSDSSATTADGGASPAGRGGGHLMTTGQMGDVMQESSRIAFTFARGFLANHLGGNAFYDSNDVHMHVPEGATPKDGPSAGVTMVTALLSLATDRPIRQDVAMTGEISLTGKVLAVGGIKEKVIAARRAGITCIILPEPNKRDFEELPGYLKDGLEAHFATTYQEVFDVAFCEDNIDF